MHKRGFCNHKAKNCRIVTEWKCVDIIYPEAISPEERARRSAECKKKDWYGVCELCKYFKADEDQPANPATQPAAKPAEKPVYTAGIIKQGEQGIKQKPDDEDPAWDSMIEDLI